MPCRFEETLNTLKYANRAKQMSPPSAPQRNVRVNHAVDEKVEVLSDSELAALRREHTTELVKLFI